jgi:uncharacterized protein with GYD domain
MASYIILANFTSVGIRNIKTTTQRAKDFRSKTEKVVIKVKIKVKDIYWTLGNFDVVVVAESPDNETMAGMLFALGRLGNVTTQTLIAFPIDSMEKIIGKLP